MIFCYQLLENAADKFISSAIRLKKTSKKKLIHSISNKWNLAALNHQYYGWLVCYYSSFVSGGNDTERNVSNALNLAKGFQFKRQSVR